MNLLATDTAGRTTLFEALAAPTAGPSDDAPDAQSFETVLRQPEEPRTPADASGAAPESCPPPPPETEPEEKAAAKDEDNDQEQAEQQDDQANAAAVLVVPVATQPELPAVVAGDAEQESASPLEQVESSASAAAIDPDAVATTADAQEVTIADAEAETQTAALDMPEAGDDKLAAVAKEVSVTSEVLPSDAITTTTEADQQPPGDSDEAPAERESPVPSSETRDQNSQLQTALAEIANSQSALENAATPAPAGEPLSTTAASGATPQVAPPQAGRLPPELLAAAGSRPAAQAQPVTVDAARLIQRVARAFAATGDGTGEVRIRLSPPELGALRLDVRVQDGAMIARLETETAAARTTLIENLPALRERLAEQGVRIERFDVELMQRHGGGSSEQPADRRPPDQPAPQPALRERRLPQVADGVVARSVRTSELDARQLNVIV